MDGPLFRVPPRALLRQLTSSPCFWGLEVEGPGLTAGLRRALDLALGHAVALEAVPEVDLVGVARALEVIGFAVAYEVAP